MSNPSERRCEDRVNNIGNLDSNLKTTKKSLIVDISPAGAGLLILNTQEAISGNICLKVLQPDLSNVSGFNINADIIWVDEKYSSDYRKIGVQFTRLDDELKNHISQAISWLNKKDHHFLRCEVSQN
ncbi:MAG: PilZ domain-containing protein [Gammaproteobacteria bacterium]|nr:PilZ domain-containing protein [Gammaproteobacteria bacterium]